MEDTKTLLESTTVWGGIVALLSGAAGLLGYQIDATLQSDIITQITGIMTIAASIGSAVGGVIAIWGRIKATKKIAPAK
jgi:hypothetical protein